MRAVSAVFAALSATYAAAWHMTAVNSIQARVQSSTPLWDETNKAWVTPYGTTFEGKWMGAMDTVNLASVEGALMYVQAEGIDMSVIKQAWGCNRKNNMAYVWFYNITIVQTNNSIAEYSSDTSVYPEYAPFVAMDGGMCTVSGTEVVPECKQYTGIGGQPNLGPSVGGVPKNTDPRAPYPDCIWFSYPNGCFLSVFANKNAACRAQYPGGLCPYGVQPDGIKCTFTFDILGYIAIDDVVGITSMVSNTTHQPYNNRTEFCNDGGVEYDSSKNESIPFWQNPLDPEACSNRSDIMIAAYQNMTDTMKGHNMVKFPTVAELRSKNPPCWMNNPLCASATNGCRRKLLAQVCEICTSAAPDCVVKPAGSAPFPTLVKAARTVTKAQERSVVVNGTIAPPATTSSRSSGASATTVTSVSMLMLALFVATVLF